MGEISIRKTFVLYLGRVPHKNSVSSAKIGNLR